MDSVNGGADRVCGARKQREYSNDFSQFESSEMLRQLGTFAPIKSHILKGTINDYFSKAEQHYVCCISSLNRLRACVCVCVCASHCAAAAEAADSRVTEECI